MQTIPVPLFPLKYNLAHEKLILEDCIEDRGSRYTVSVFPISSLDEIAALWESCDQTATHRSYARRLLQNDGSIHYESNDDGETGAGQIILRELERYQMVDILLVVTRYFGGVKLEGDRYTHIVDGCRMVLGRVKGL